MVRVLRIRASIQHEILWQDWKHKLFDYLWAPVAPMVLWTAFAALAGPLGRAFGGRTILYGGERSWRLAVASSHLAHWRLSERADSGLRLHGDCIGNRFRVGALATGSDAGVRTFVASTFVLQFILLAYDADRALPSAADAAAGRRVLATFATPLGRC